MIIIDYPTPDFRVKKEADKQMLFDAFRKKWVVLTPEEWVRQNFLQYLIQKLDYPSSLIALEKEIEIGSVKRRFDILVYDRNHQPWLLVECKSMDIKLTEEVVEQIVHYNMAVPVKHLIITNGTSCFGWEIIENGLIELVKIPAYTV
jgi:hypothetical protein